MKTEGALKETREQIYCCSYCKFVTQTIGVENLEPVDELKFVYHLKQVHNLAP